MERTFDKEIHLAPLQGFTDTTFRRLFAEYYGGVDYCYTPFIRIERGEIRRRDIKELEADELENLVPQILPANGEEVKILSEEIVAHGYKRIDINMGCPFPPIAAHGKGCVLFNYPERIEDILKTAAELSDIEYSIKIRLGFADCSQWKEVIDVINETPLRHVTVHPRYGKQQYKGECDKDAFGEFMEASKHKVIYNGELKTVDDVDDIVKQFPQVAGVMLGRGILADMSLARELRGGQKLDTNNFRRYHAELADTHAQKMSGDNQVLGKLKPYWEYLYPEAPHRLHKNIQKAKSLDLYLAAVSALLHAVDHPSSNE